MRENRLGEADRCPHAAGWCNSASSLGQLHTISGASCAPLKPPDNCDVADQMLALGTRPAAGIRRTFLGLLARLRHSARLASTPARLFHLIAVPVGEVCNCHSIWCRRREAAIYSRVAAECGSPTGTALISCFTSTKSRSTTATSGRIPS